jgi:hypothetical protein
LGGLLVAIVALVGSGSELERWQTAVSFTARWSLFVFLVLFLAAPLVRLFKGHVTRTLTGSERGLLLAFAGAHFVHLGAVLTYFALGGTVPPRVVIVLGGFGYLLIALLAGTMNDWSITTLGLSNWRRLRAFGLYYVWLIFALTYVARATKISEALAPRVLLVLLTLAFLLRSVTPLLSPSLHEK